jgi:hypothetical protein
MGCPGVHRIIKVIFPEMSLLEGWAEKVRQGTDGIETYVNCRFAPLDIDRAVKKSWQPYRR